MNKNGIDTRPIISGNFLKQPCINLYKLNKSNEKFPSTQEIEDRGFLLGYMIKLLLKDIKKLTNNLLNIN